MGLNMEPPLKPTPFANEVERFVHMVEALGMHDHYESPDGRYDHDPVETLVAGVLGVNDTRVNPFHPSEGEW